MISIIKSQSEFSNNSVNELPRVRGENNIDWIGKALKELKAKGDSIQIILLGGTSPVDFRLRVAQSQLRHDLSPSSWSHVALISKLDLKEIGNSVINEISLDPDKGFGFPAPVNGVQEGLLKSYKNTRKYPNIALISLLIDKENLDTVIKELWRNRSSLDLIELILQWLAFAWGVGKTANPLFEGYGIPSAVMIESILSSMNFELTPNIPSQNSTPEAIWQAAKWWQIFYEETLGVKNGVQGCYFKPHELVK